MAKIMTQWINDYAGRGTDLKHSNDIISGFQVGMWMLLTTVGSEFSGTLCWDTDWEKKGAGFPTAGEAERYVEKVSMAYFAGHGGPYGPIFARSDKDDGVAHYNDLRMGEYQMLKCVVFDADRILESYWRWKSSMRGLHHLLSFIGNRNDNGERGRYMTYFMRSMRMSLGHSWGRACIATDALSCRPGWLYADYPDQDRGNGSYNEMWQNGFKPSGYITPKTVKFVKL